MSRTLKFWVEVECYERGLSRIRARDVATVLQAFERRGDAMRAVNRRGQVIWKASPQLLDELAAAEKEVDDEWKNEN
jgi:hypothetical protein